MNDDFDKKNNSEQHKELFNGLNELNLVIRGLPEELRDKFDEIYAPKWTASVIVWGMSVVGTAVLVAILGTVILSKVQAFF